MESAYVTGEVLEAAWIRNWGRLVQFAGALGLDSHAQAEDTAQDAIEAAIRRKDRTDLPPLTNEHFVGYLFRIVHNKAASANRSAAASQAAAEKLRAHPANNAPSPEGDVFFQELYDIVKAKIGQDRAELLNLQLQGYTVAEIAIELNMSEKTVKSRLNSTRQILHRAAKKGYFDDYR